MRVLMFTWEFPPLISGGLGMACYGMVKALLKQGIRIDLVLPTKEAVFFPLREVQDVDVMPTMFIDPKRQKQFMKMIFTDVKERMEYIGLTQHPETYLQLNEVMQFIQRFSQTRNERNTLSETYLWEEMALHLIGDEDLIKKVQEYTLRAEYFATHLEFDLIHAHDWLCYPSGMLAKKLSNRPLIVHIHATEFDRSGGPGDERIHKIEHAGMMYADQVIAVSQYTAQMIMSRYRIDTGRIKIIHNAFTIEEDMNFEQLRIFKGPTILFLGRITLQKGPDYFVDVADLVLKVHPDARFIMAGTGDMGRKFIHKSAALKLRNRFLFTGFLNRKQVERIIRASDIYVLPSVSEPFGIAPLEAMAYGVTAIISKQSGVSEVVNHAFKIDFWDVERMADTINHLIENPDICRKIGNDGRQEVHRIQWDEAAEKIRQLYASILANYLKSQCR